MRGSESSPSSIAPISSEKEWATRLRWYVRARCSAMGISVSLGLVVQYFCVGVGDVGRESRGDAVRGAVDRLEVLSEGLHGAGDDRNLDRGLIPDGAAFVHLGYGE